MRLFTEQSPMARELHGSCVTSALSAKYTFRFSLSPSLMQVVTWFFLVGEQAYTASNDMHCRNAQTCRIALYYISG